MKVNARFDGLASNTPRLAYRTKTSVGVDFPHVGYAGFTIVAHVKRVVDRCVPRVSPAGKTRVAFIFHMSCTVVVKPEESMHLFQNMRLIPRCT